MPRRKERTTVGMRGATATPPKVDEGAQAPIPLALVRAFTLLGVSPYEARVLLALLRLGSANTMHLSSLSGVPRTSTYQVLEALSAKRLAARVPGQGPAVWAAVGREEVFKRLEAELEVAHQERLREHRVYAEEAKMMLMTGFPETPFAAMPFVHILPGPVQTKKAYEDMLEGARQELVMFTRPPYASMLGPPNPAVMDMLERGVSAQVLYEADKWERSDAHAFRQEMEAYHQAGVQARLTDHLPVKLVVVDRRTALVGMTNPVAPEASYPTHMLVEHPGYSAIQAAAFDQLWAAARPLTHPATAADEPLLEVTNTLAVSEHSPAWPRTW